MRANSASAEVTWNQSEVVRAVSANCNDRNSSTAPVARKTSFASQSSRVVMSLPENMSQASMIAMAVASISASSPAATTARDVVFNGSDRESHPEYSANPIAKTAAPNPYCQPCCHLRPAIGYARNSAPAAQEHMTLERRTVSRSNCDRSDVLRFASVRHPTAMMLAANAAAAKAATARCPPEAANQIAASVAAKQAITATRSLSSEIVTTPSLNAVR